jgi:hypothetical protein
MVWVRGSKSSVENIFFGPPFTLGPANVRKREVQVLTLV